MCDFLLSSQLKPWLLGRFYLTRETHGGVSLHSLLLWLSHSFSLRYPFTLIDNTLQEERRPSKWGQAKPIYSELAGARELATITCVWQGTKGGCGCGCENSVCVAGGETAGITYWRVIGLGKLVVGCLEVRLPVWLVWPTSMASSGRPWTRIKGRRGKY